MLSVKFLILLVPRLEMRDISRVILSMRQECEPSHVFSKLEIKQTGKKG